MGALVPGRLSGPSTTYTPFLLLYRRYGVWFWALRKMESKRRARRRTDRNENSRLRNLKPTGRSMLALGRAILNLVFAPPWTATIDKSRPLEKATSSRIPQGRGSGVWQLLMIKVPYVSSRRGTIWLARGREPTEVSAKNSSDRPGVSSWCSPDGASPSMLQAGVAPDDAPQWAVTSLLHGIEAVSFSYCYFLLLVCFFFFLLFILSCRFILRRSARHLLDGNIP